jgi:predicted nucleotidyltransferase component of viral defense system
MLTYESLIEQSKSREMPPTKIRGILREYIQILMLKELYRTEEGKKICFTGGTYLRLVHNLKRFSEDLDFNSNSITKREFTGLLEIIRTELKRINLDCSLEFSYFNHVCVSKVTFPGIEKEYGVISKYSKKKGIIIKVELNKMKYRIKKETKIISGFGEFYPCVCTDRGILFADKIDALIKKKRGRHIYDIMFLLSHKYPIDKKYLEFLKIKKDPLEAIADRIKIFSREELRKQAETLRPFLFDEKEADKVEDAKEIILPLIEQYSLI